MPHWLLIHSAFLGPASWHGVAAQLQGNGQTAVVPDLRPHALSAAHIAGAAAIAAPGPVAVAVHSAAGALVPALAEELGERLERVVFVDAAMPEPSRSWADRAPSEMVGMLRKRGSLTHAPPWSTWWHAATLEQLLPDATVRARVLSECQPVPWTLLEETVTADQTWLHRPAAYIQLSEAYAAEAELAETLGWPLLRLTSDHLALITDPAAVADVLVSLV